MTIQTSLPASKQVFILTGEGIECEKEIARYFKVLGFNTQDIPLPAFFRGDKTLWQKAKMGDWAVIPGGFAFADHFGAGLLLSHELSKAAFFSRALEMGLNLLGVCNGFQMLVAAGLFGRDVQLLANFDRKRGVAPGFQDRWVRLKSGDKSYTLQARHGEGRLVRASAQWESHVRPFVHYDDPAFDNGSIENVAGLCAEFPSGSRVWGLMPHPETALRLIDSPDCAPAEFLEANRAELLALRGDGLRLWHEVLSL